MADTYGAGEPWREAAWVARAKAGDPEAFAAIVRAYRRRLYAWCFERARNPSDAEDLVQETFLRAYRALPRTTADLHLNAWLYRIATNACTDLFRRRRSGYWVSFEVGLHDRPLRARDDTPEAALLDAEIWRAFDRVCAALRPRHRLVLVLRARDGLSLAEIGARLDLTRPAVKSLLFRAREEFRAVAGGERVSPRKTDPMG
jgi:RNA polymerase sigma-70 factor (ECF subfamily)